MKDMESRARVFLSDTRKGIPKAVGDVFDCFGGSKLLKRSRDVYIKVNAIDLKKYCYTDVSVVEETIRYFKRNGAGKIYIIENCTQANFTRLVFDAIGMMDVCKKTGAVPVFLDETPAVPIFLEGVEGFVDISSFVHERLIKQRDENLYISLPKLKTHSMSQVTLSIKNQYGLIHQYSRSEDHNYRLHEKFAGIYRVLRPDFSLIEGIIATSHGHYPSEKNADKCVVPMDLLIGGDDPLAVDTVGAALMGFDLEEVAHLKLCRDTGIGIGDINRIEIINRDLFEGRRKKLTCELLEDFPPDLTIIRGRERCCKEGCRRNTETLVEILYCDYGGKGGFTILMGKGLDPEKVSKIEGRVHIAGSCAIQECGSELQNRLGKKNVTMSPGCNNLALTAHGICRQMKVNPLSLVPINPVRAIYLLAVAKLKGSRANITPLF